MRRFFIEEIKEKDGFCTVPEPEARHIVKVLRMKQGDRMILMDSKGKRFEASIESAALKELIVKLIKKLPEPPPSPVSIDICQAIIKPRVMNYMIEKTSELGVSKIIPFYSERTVIKLEENKVQHKMRHWTEISRSAAKQSGRPLPADISEPLPFRELLHDLKEKEGLKVVLWESEDDNDIKDLLRSRTPESRFTGIVGPEGGFSRDEINELKDAGFIPVSMGTRILRAETAAIALVTIAQYEWGDMGTD
ncbi:16S rRNA (uracil(1498)-N(3))-methyltransferase [Thermodesulfobacteriota bacterium]